jgi:hypothetical protein
MTEVPKSFRQSIAEHNRHCWIAAGFSWAGAFVTWLFFGALYVSIVLLLETVRTGDTSLSVAPRWMIPLGGLVAVILLVFASIDRWYHRYRATPDRPIIGWHLFGEVLFLPARLTYAIWDHLELRVKLTPAELDEAWRLLQLIAEHKRIPITALGQEFSDSALLTKLLLALQLTTWIDLQRGEEDWYYYIPSDAEPRFQQLMQELI